MSSLKGDYCAFFLLSKIFIIHTYCVKNNGSFTIGVNIINNFPWRVHHTVWYTLTTEDLFSWQTLGIMKQMVTQQYQYPIT